MSAIATALGYAGTESSQKFSTARASQYDSVVAQLANAQSQIASLLNRVSQLEAVLVTMIGSGQSLSAGGLIGRPDGQGNNYVMGFPFATGDLIWSSNLAPGGDQLHGRPGWLLCDGAEVALSDYPELARVLQNAGIIYGNPSSPLNFVLPSASGLGVSTGSVYVRT